MNDKAKKSKVKPSDGDRAFYESCGTLIEILKDKVAKRQREQLATRELADPCAEKYRDKLAANTAFYTGVESLQVLRQASMDADMAYEQCVMENGPTTGMPSDTIDGGDGVDTVPDMPSDDTIDGVDGVDTIEN